MSCSTLHEWDVQCERIKNDGFTDGFTDFPHYSTGIRFWKEKKYTQEMRNLSTGVCVGDC